MKRKTGFLNGKFVLLCALILLGALSLSACGSGGGGGAAGTTAGTAGDPPFLDLTAGSGVFTDAQNDASPNNDYVDITAATVAVTATDITCTITLRNLPPTLTFNQAGVPLTSVEYLWAVEFDTDNDNTPEYDLILWHAKDSATEVTGGILANTQADAESYDSSTSTWTAIAPAVATINLNTITLSIAKSAHADLSNITSSTRVRIITYVYNTITPYSDFID